MRFLATKPDSPSARLRCILFSILGVICLFFPAPRSYHIDLITTLKLAILFTLQLYYLWFPFWLTKLLHAKHLLQNTPYTLSQFVNFGLAGFTLSTFLIGYTQDHPEFIIMMMIYPIVSLFMTLIIKVIHGVTS